MALNDLLGSLKRGVVSLGLGLALLSPVAYGCGDDVENNYYGDEGGNGGSYTCEDACSKISQCDWIDPNIDDYYSYCLDQCYHDEWSDLALGCTMENSCDNIDALCEQYIP